MANYRRLISYIYAYEGDIKGKNIGFVKLESRNGQCRLSINVKKVYVGGSDLGVYLLSPKQEINLGNIFIRGGSGEFRASVAVDNVGDSGVSMEECYGLSIHEPGDEWRSYRTIWEDAVAQAAQVELEKTAPSPEQAKEVMHKQAEEAAVRLDQELRENEAREEKTGGSSNAQGAEPLYDLHPVEKLVEEKPPQPEEGESQMERESQTEGQFQTEGQSQTGEQFRKTMIREELREHHIAGRPLGNSPFREAREAQARPRPAFPPAAVPAAPAEGLAEPQEPLKNAEPEQPPEPETQSQLQSQPEEELLLEDPGILEQLEQEERAALKPGQLWEMFSRRWPKIQAFDCAGGCEILTIKPQDIGLMPREIWTYGNNSFLLHGYYNYRYLILAKVGDSSREKSRYILGVPGNYYSNEKYMASMFGFPHFVLAKRQSTPGGRFGYWYTDIRLDYVTA